MHKLHKTVLAVCTSLVCTTAVADEVKMGFLGGITGPLEQLTPPILAGAQLAVDQVNAQGGILGDHKIDLIAGDSTCADATAAANAADRLVNTEKVIAIVGPMCSGATISAANNAGIPGNTVLVSPSATAPSITDLDDNDLLFRTAPSDAYQGQMLANLLGSKNIKEVAITYVNNDYGKGFSDAFDAAFSASGGKILANAAHEEGKTDYRAELGSLAGSGASTLVVLAYANGSGQTILRQAVESGDFTTYVGGDGMVDESLLTGIDANELEGMIATKPGTPDLPGAEIYNNLATDAGMDPTAVFAPQAYDAAFLLALAIEQNGSESRDGVKEALRKVASAPGEVILPGEWNKAVKLLKDGKDINYEGASGQHEFDAAGDVPGVIVEMALKNGQFVTLGEVK